MPILVTQPPLTQADIPGIVAQAVKAALDTVVYTDRKGVKVTVKSGRGAYAYDQVTDGGSIDLRLDKLEATAVTLDATLRANGINDAATVAAVDALKVGINEIRAALAKPILPAVS